MTTTNKTAPPRRRCACGCGEWTLRTWYRGHDSVAMERALATLGFETRLAFIQAVHDGEIKRVSR